MSIAFRREERAIIPAILRGIWKIVAAAGWAVWKGGVPAMNIAPI